ncbi:hypothetical protein QTP70_018053 [Hemibagrus guttatus]|uniref:Tomoregulin-2 n=1 Tax=Hemibagrus guttatus TaxID=175788 RepID=A0AAE0R562_9TELE|nr:hypothetical protein QTP70_018053 [Hemibagrus guttatus]
MEPRCQRLAVGRCGLTPRYFPRAAPPRFPLVPQRLPDAHRVELLGDALFDHTVKVMNLTTPKEGDDDRDTDLFLCDTNTCKFDGECLRIGDIITCICDFKCNNDYAPVCGSNNKFYNNECLLRRDACKQQSEILVVAEGPCPIVSEQCLYSSKESDNYVTDFLQELYLRLLTTFLGLFLFAALYFLLYSLKAQLCTNKDEMLKKNSDIAHNDPGMTLSFSSLAEAGSGSGDEDRYKNTLAYCYQGELMTSPLRGDDSQLRQLLGARTFLARSITMETRLGVQHFSCDDDIGAGNEGSAENGQKETSTCDICQFGAECDVDAEDVWCVCNIDCSHISFNPVCASDGRSYDNPCQVKEASCQRQERIEVKFLGHCQGKRDMITGNKPGDGHYARADLPEEKPEVSEVARGIYIPCPEHYKNYCIHGDCEYPNMLSTPSCSCHSGFSGPQCDTKEYNVLYVVPGSGKVRYVLIASIIGALQVAIICVVVLCITRKCPRTNRINRQKQNVTHYNSENTLRASTRLI